MMRQMGKQRLTINAWYGCFAFIIFMMMSIEAIYAQTSTTVTTYVTDPLSGVAIEGYDPVAYVTDDQAQLGRSEYEYYWSGVPWYFVSQANRDVFIKDPEIYAPLFGGYGITAVSRGFLSEGNPRIFVVAGDRLMLFHSSGNREAFLLSQRETYEKAAKNWEKLKRDLVHN